MKTLRDVLDHSSLPGGLQRPVPLSGIATPALLVDGERLGRNLRGMQALADTAGVRLRPHVKTHKMPALAGLQRELGARGLCTAKVSEAEIFAADGFDDLLVAYPVVGQAAEAAAALAGRMRMRAGDAARLDVVVDSPEGVRGLSRAAVREGVALGVWVKIDVGLHRCGLEPEDPNLEVLAHQVRNAPGLRLRGLLTHAGQVYRARPAEVESIGRHEGEVMAATARRLERAGLGALEVGLGSTPTVPVSARVAGVSEIHAGVYVFGDRQQVRLRAMRWDDMALTVLATVVSHPVEDRWIVDAGSKVLSSDQGAHGVKGLEGFGAVRHLEEHGAPGDPEALPFTAGLVPLEESAEPGRPLVSRLSEEHGVIEGGAQVQAGIGERLEIVPNHACPTVNLAERVYVTRGEGAGREAIAAWAVSARGRVR